MATAMRCLRLVSRRSSFMSKLRLSNEIRLALRVSCSTTSGDGTKLDTEVSESPQQDSAFLQKENDVLEIISTETSRKGGQSYKRKKNENQNEKRELLLKEDWQGKGDTNYRRKKNENENEKRELLFKEDLQGKGDTNYRRKKNENENEKRELLFKEDLQDEERFTLTVEGFPKETKKSDLMNYFRRFGFVTVNFPSNQKQVGRSLAYITYRKERSMMNALKYDKHILNDSRLKVRKKPQVPLDCVETFEEFINNNVSAAHRSLLFLLDSRDLYEQTLSDCATCGQIHKAYLIDQQNGAALLVEFHSQETCVMIVDSLYKSHNIVASPTSVISCSNVITESDKGKETRLEVKKETNSFPLFHATRRHDIISSEMDSWQLSDFMRMYVRGTVMTEADTAIRFFVLGYLKKHIHRAFPHTSILPFGSSVNGLGTTTGDLDICVEQYYRRNMEVNLSTSTLWMPHFQVELSLDNLAEIVSKLPDFHVKEVIQHAKVPILQTRFQTSMEREGIMCDISIGNSGGVLMSQWLKYLTQMDDRIPVLALVVKRWASEYLKDMVPQTFTIQLLMIFFLQNTGVIPTLERLLDGKIDTSVEKRSSDPYLKWNDHVEWPAKVEGVDHILREFFAYFKMFNSNKHGMSLLDGKVMQKPTDVEGMFLCNPFEQGPLENVARNVRKHVLPRIIERMSRASFELGRGTKQLPSATMAARYLGITPEVYQETPIIQSKPFVIHTPAADRTHRMTSRPSRQPNSQRTSVHERHEEVDGIRKLIPTNVETKLERLGIGKQQR